MTPKSNLNDAQASGKQVVDLSDIRVQLALTELLQRLYNKVQPVIQKDTGQEFNAVHHKDLDYEYWKLTGGTMQ